MRIIAIILLFQVSAVTAGNLALRQPASMSITLNDNVIAGSAVDGNPQATLYLDSKYWCAVTSLSTDPWWRVDLGKSYIVEEVKIFSRADGDGNGLINFEIRIGDSLENEGNSNRKCGDQYNMTSSQNKSFYCHPGIQGRYVNIRVPGKNKKLEICEVSVNPNPTGNLALHKSATQSSTDHSGSPKRGVDGSSDGAYDKNNYGSKLLLSCTHTNDSGEKDPWWRVDLGSSQSVSEVFIVNRVALLERLVNIEIRVGNSLRNNGNSNPRCGGPYSMATLLKASFYCKPRKTGRYLNIRILGNSMILTLCEVEVYSESRAFLKNKPKIPTTKDVFNGNLTSLLCPEPFGYPEPFVAWVKDGVVLQNSSWNLRLNLTAVNQTNDGSVMIDCVVSNKHGADYHRFMLNVVHSQKTMCTEYKDITSKARKVLHKGKNQESAQNDSDINPTQWYRFIDHVTKEPMKIPDSCQNPWTCGTQAPGWLQGGHPTLEDGIAMRNVCFSWNGNCCFTKVQAQVRLCYGFFVYKLQPTTFAVKAKYCVEQAVVDHKDVVFKHNTSKNGKQYALEGHVITLERHVSEAWKCMVYCLTEKTCASYNYHPHSKVCELNRSTASRDPASVRERPGNEYHEKVEELVIIPLT